jgi:(R,R)-butanediol dehydrogenase/meso-butanediol dehydrogenase/diacetyl reductase
MKAAVYFAARRIEVLDVPEPGVIGPRDVLLRPTLCGICGTDLHEFVSGPIVIPVEPHPLNGSQLPQILGHELSAEVAAVGADVTRVRVGDRVSVMPLITCGRCRYCERGQHHLCERMACVGLSSPWGGFAELAVVSEQQVAPLPAGVSDAQGALVEPAAVAAYGCDRAGVAAGAIALITGFGPIGALAALYARACGAEVMVSEPNAHRAEFARSLGIRHVVAAGDDASAEVRSLTGGTGVDCAIECSGHAQGLSTCLDAVRSRGVVAQTGLHTRPAEIDPMTISLREITLTGTWAYPIWDWPRLIGMISRGVFPVERVVTARVGLDAVVPAGFEALSDRATREIKVMVESR